MKWYARFRLPTGFATSGLVMVVLLLGPSPASGQHGGGGHAGGGGGHFGGGHFAGFGASHSHSSSQQTVSHSSARPAAESTAPLVASGALADPEARTEEFARFRSAPAHTTIGFPPAEQSTTFPAIRPRSAQSAGPLSFSGEGHQIWQDSAPPSTIARTLFSAHLMTSPEMRPHAPHIVRPPAFFAPYPVFSPTFRFYGFSPFWGYGWGCGPFSLWWTLGCSGFGYGGYGPGYGYGFGGYYSPAWDDSEPPPASDDSSNEPSLSTWQNPPASEDLQGDAVRSIPNTVIYLQDGSSYEVTDYWLADNKLHYVTNYGGKNSVALAQIDMQRTVDANAARGVDFTLHSAPPASLTPPPSADSAPPAPQQQ
jgi:hypothetical protein